MIKPRESSDLPTKVALRPFSISISGKRQQSCRLFREGSIGSRSWGNNEARQLNPKSNNEECMLTDADSEEYGQTSAPTPHRPLFPSLPNSRHEHSLISTTGSDVQDLSTSSNSLSPCAPPIPTAYVTMPRSLAQGTSIHSSTTPELPKHEEIQGSRSHLAKNVKISPPPTEIQDIRHRATAKFFQQSSIHESTDNSTLKVVTLQGGYYIDNKDQKNRANDFDQDPQGLDPVQFVALTLKKKESQIEKLHGELQISQNMLDQSSSRLWQLEKDRQVLVSVNGVLKGEITDRLSSIQKWRQETLSVVETIAQEAKKYKSILQAVQEEIQSFREDREYLSNNQTELIASFSEIKRVAEGERQTLLSQVKELQQSRERELNLYKQQYEEITEIRQRCENYQLQIQRQDADNVEHLERILALETDNQSKKGLIREMEASLASYKNEVKEIAQSATDKRESLFFEFNALKEVLSKTQRGYLRCENELSEAKVTIKCLEKRYNELVWLTQKPSTSSIGTGTSDDPGVDLHLRFEILDRKSKELEISLDSLKLDYVSVLGEKADLHDQLKELSSINTSGKRRNEDYESRNLELQKRHDYTKQQLEVALEEKSSLQSFIMSSLSENTTKLNSTIHEYAMLKGDVRNTGSQSHSWEIEIESWRTKVRLLETENKILKHQAEHNSDLKYSDNPEDRIDQSPRATKYPIKASSAQFLSVDQLKSSALQGSPILLSGMVGTQNHVAPTDSIGDLIEWPLDTSPESSLNSQSESQKLAHILDIHQSISVNESESTNTSKKRKGGSFNRDGEDTKSGKKILTVILDTTATDNVAKTLANTCDDRDDDSCDSGDFTIASKASPTVATLPSKRRTDTPTGTGTSNNDRGNTKERGTARGKRGGRGIGRGSRGGCGKSKSRT
ncbi:hypothetical protein BGZ76_002570 [Entomortierella beljakovae]|nr:hypothetical protein BGZ76_002570 [Entomortierella beljakovae]